ncbi:MAG: META domain-containing protein [Devosia sp.]|uniref:META domain-containing protein n=1 Tax=Devosia sp. TaxID=1871048 RepID=UPI0024C71604|nr:META domain-containing protein [Devosia sp.]UYO01091.1 MAG: META domain-containing protein [Devosia sp.]
MFMRLFLGLAMLALSVFPTLAQPVSLSGTVTYRERMALPPGASLTIAVVTLGGNSVIASAHSAVVAGSQPPLDFTLNLRSQSVHSAGKVGLVATISHGGTPLFRNAVPVPVDLSRPDGYAIMVQRLPAPPPPAEPPPAPEPEPEPEDDMPIDAELLETVWVVTSIGGRPVSAERPATLSIALDRRAGGTSGCNSYFSEAVIEADTIAFSAAAATRMACAPELMEQESAYFAALAAVRFYQVEGNSLRLLDAARVPLVGLVRQEP